MSRVEAEAEAEWPASVALLEAFSGYGVSSIVPANRAEARERAMRGVMRVELLMREL